MKTASNGGKRGRYQYGKTREWRFFSDRKGVSTPRKEKNDDDCKHAVRCVVQHGREVREKEKERHTHSHTYIDQSRWTRRALKRVHDNCAATELSNWRRSTVGNGTRTSARGHRWTGWDAWGKARGRHHTTTQQSPVEVAVAVAAAVGRRLVPCGGRPRRGGRAHNFTYCRRRRCRTVPPPRRRQTTGPRRTEKTMTFRDACVCYVYYVMVRRAITCCIHTRTLSPCVLIINNNDTLTRAPGCVVYVLCTYTTHFLHCTVQSSAL